MNEPASPGTAPAVEPQLAEARQLLANGQLEAAATWIEELLQTSPDHCDGLLTAGVIAYRRNDLGAAEGLFRRVLQAGCPPDQARQMLGAVLRFQGRLDEAVEVLKAAAASGRPIVLRLLAETYVQMKREADAEPVLRALAAEQPNDALAAQNLGTVLRALGRDGEAANAYRQAIAVSPDNAEAHLGLAYCLLKTGALRQGWDELEWRFAAYPEEAQRVSRAKLSVWRGEDLEGHAVMISQEAGYGDAIQFVRFVSDVRARGGEVYLNVDPQLRRLFETVPGVAGVLSPERPTPWLDAQIPMLSLPRALGVEVATIPAPIPYLTPPADRAAVWKDRLPRDAFNVGIAWQGNPAAKVDDGRSFPLACMAPLGRADGVRFYSLQKGSGTEQLDTPPDGLEVLTLGPDYEAGDFAETAAVISQLDMVITCDTAVGHLAGAIGKPVWLALNAVSEWRWMSGDRSPWYPTARLFRQAERGDWDTLFMTIAGELAALAKAGGARKAG